ncbi:MAG TPA: LLM class flavin-dependent oxidoreductase [Thermoanaerobaculia bacterium]|jgi:luciferase family oxidoreductase group 1|nr:LLM class flavin-dependent oxidoreductase [Thermoanaerobaculia bacterium]
MELSILDFGNIGDAVDLMAQADRSGYRRYWLGEHHNEWQCSNPLLLGALLAATSDGIRVGSGGVCLDYHNPYQVAEDARLIEFMLPGRFDLGVTRGLTLNPEMRAAMLDGRAVDSLRSYYEKLADLHGFLTGRLPAGHSLAQKLPLEPGPPMWVLGTGEEAARWAGRHGTGFCFSLHHAPAERDGPAILGEYRRAFVPSPEFAEPEAIVMVSMASGPAISDAPALAPDVVRTVIEGPVAECVAKLGEIARRFAVDEVMVLLRSYGEWPVETCRDLAEQAGLTPRAEPR